jgi:hypothetical protein
MGKNKKGQQGSNKKGVKISSKQKASQIFKVASSGGQKKAQKKTKEIPKRLKQLDLKTKDKADQQLKNLHLNMVSKKEVKKSQPVGKKKLPVPSTAKVQDGLNKMNVN